jgi:hypothetical protein
MLKFRKETISFTSVCPSAQNNWAPTERISIKFNIWEFFENLSRKFMFRLNLTKITGTLHDDRYTFLSHLAHFFWEWEMFHAKLVEKLNARILCLINIFLKSRRSWNNVEKYCRAGQATDGNVIRRMRFACWKPKATNTHTEYVTLITFLLQQWLHERVSTLRYTFYLVTGNQHSNNDATHRLRSLPQQCICVPETIQTQNRSAHCSQFIKSADNSCIIIIIIIIILAHVIPTLLQAQKCVLGSRTNEEHTIFPLLYPGTRPPGDAHQCHCAFDIQEDTKCCKGGFR